MNEILGLLRVKMLVQQEPENKQGKERSGTQKPRSVFMPLSSREAHLFNIMAVFLPSSYTQYSRIIRAAKKQLPC